LDRYLKGTSRNTDGIARPREPLLAQMCVALLECASSAQKKHRDSWLSLARNAWARWGLHALALADQAVVSGASFLTMVVIGRFAAPSQLGLYAIGASLLVSSINIQDSLISLPYTIQRHRTLGTPAEHAGSSLTLSALLSSLATLVLSLTALALSVRGVEPGLQAMTWAVAAVVPFALLRQFGRRFAFAHLHIGQALMLDSTVALMQLAGLGWLGWTGRISGATAIAALGAACASIAIVWLYLSRHNLAIPGNRVRATAQQSWALGKWLFACQIATSLQWYVAYWVLAVVLGTTATGIYAACVSVVLFANPLIMGLSNIFMPRAVLAFEEGGGAQLRRQVIRDSLLLGAVMTLFCLIIVLVGEDLMRLLYHGKAYEGHGHIVTVLALGLLASAAAMPPANALASIERASASFWTWSFGTALTVVLVWWLVIRWGLSGAASGFFVGNLAVLGGSWIAFLALVPRDRPEGQIQNAGEDGLRFQLPAGDSSRANSGQGRGPM
jgi:O-antigen/teichoic acid export membrane protein